METEIVVAIIAGCATVLAAVIAGVFTLITKKSKGRVTFSLSFFLSLKAL